jgi:hypothetical protein
MIPIPNVLAGALIGLVNRSWAELLVSAAVWPVVYCAYVAITERPRAATTIAQFRERGQRLLFGSATSTFYAVEFATAIATALPIACAVFLIKRILM